ncbi:ficolin-1-like isoform X2 [Physella acuta]|uniref:ficolin-1-like isoform X2 n=1 Tax=Physella acuta TaxID=109671 RepID=UPI0027DAD0ED|nr:ficolin-1-like isoform X2 [Physella acuta]
MGTLKISARAFVLVFALNFFLCSGQHDDDKIKPQDMQKREDTINKRRIKGDVSFLRTWNDYKNGFGSNSGDFWIGNDVIYQLTNLGYNELRFDMKYNCKDYYAVYRGFKVENEAAKYKMYSMSFSGGNVENLFIHHNGMKFTTIDSDNDIWSPVNCAEERSGGWWYSNCHWVNVNGEWASRVYDKGIHWYSITGWSDSLDFVEMKLRQM